MLRVNFWIFTCFLCGFTSAQNTFEISPDLTSAYQLISDLRLDTGQILLEEIKVKEPENRLVYLIENYLDFYRIFITEEESLLEDLEGHKDLRIAKIREGDPNSPFFLFAEAEINIQWAIARMKFDQKMTAARELYRAYSLLEENKKRFPEFRYNDKSLSFIHVMAQSIPGFIRSILNIEGSVKKGTDEIKKLYNWSQAQDRDIFHDEITIIYAYILFYQNNLKEEAWRILKTNFLDGGPITSPIIQFVVANLAQKTSRTDLAIELLEKSPPYPDALSFHYLRLLLGKWKLYRMDEDALGPLEDFVAYFSGQHYIKEAYQKIAWYHLIIKKDLAAYKKNMDLLSKKGQALVDEDKQAEVEAKKGPIPHPDLLQARLLFDGGYYRRAQTQLIRKAHVFSSAQDILEYNYRMGRISQELKNYPEALTYYTTTLQSKEKKSYMLCNAALQSALILEKQERNKQALEFIEVCLELKPKRYRSSLHQKAKSARDRIKNR